MFTIIITAHKRATQHGKGRPYLARLKPGLRESIDREFILSQKSGNNRLVFAANAMPGDLFEARRWLWDDVRQQYGGGTIWFGVQPDGSFYMLTRGEAFSAAFAVSVTSNALSVDVPDVTRASRMVPEDLRIYPAQEVAPQIAHYPPALADQHEGDGISS